jgi:hypothetical protein
MRARVEDGCARRTRAADRCGNGDGARPLKSVAPRSRPSSLHQPRRSIRPPSGGLKRAAMPTLDSAIPLPSDDGGRSARARRGRAEHPLGAHPRRPARQHPARAVRDVVPARRARRPRRRVPDARGTQRVRARVAARLLQGRARRRRASRPSARPRTIEILVDPERVAALAPARVVEPPAAPLRPRPPGAPQRSLRSGRGRPGRGRSRPAAG